MRPCDGGYEALGDFVSAADLATPYHERPNVIARKMVRLIVNRALAQVLPPPRRWWHALPCC